MNNIKLDDIKKIVESSVMQTNADCVLILIERKKIQDLLN